MNVKFLSLTQAQFEAIEVKAQGTFYLVDNTKLYLGSEYLSNNSELVSAVGRVAAIEADYLKGADKTSLQGQIDSINEELGALTGSESGQSINTMITNAINTLRTELQAEIDADVKVEADRAKGVEADLESRLSAVEEDYLTSESDYLKAADKTELEGKITAEETRATGVEGGLNTRLTAVEEDVNAFFADADLTASAKDTLKEIQEYINSDATAAAEMTASINGVKGRVDTIEADYLKTADKTELTNAINGKVAQADHDILAGRVTTVEGAVATKAESSVVTGIDGRVEALEGKVDVEKVTTAIATAKGEATSYTDAEIAKLSDVYEAKGNAAKAEAAARLYADGLASNYDAAGSAATAESNAKSHAETKATEALNAAKAYTDAALVWETVE